MSHFQFEQEIKQLEARKGGYNYLKIDAHIVDQLDKKRATRLVCSINGKVSYSCGLNYLGDGNFYIILANRYMKQLGTNVGDVVNFEISEDPNPLGVEVPEVLSVLLEQDTEAKDTYDRITDGKKRSLIYSIIKIKDLDKQVNTILEFLNKERIKLKK